MKILIGGDLVPTQSNAAMFAAGDGEALVGAPLLQVLRQADFRIFNLEVPLADRETPIPKCGPCLIAPTASAAGLQAVGADFVTLANNHILDQGEAGLASTVETLTRAGIAFSGVGDRLQAAAEPYIIRLQNMKIGILCCAEHEFSIAGADTPGAAPFDPLETPDQVAALKARCDRVIVLYHGGKEHYRYPSPDLQKTCRKLAQKGADLVVCQHSHCIGCAEEYMGSTIVYGQGNFLFDRSNLECWQTGLLVAVDENFHISYIPLAKTGNTVRLGEDPKVLEEFHRRSRELSESGFAERRYKEFARAEYNRYLSLMQGRRYRSLPFRVLDKLTGHRLKPWLLHRLYGREQMLMARNFLECEAHLELMRQIAREGAAR